MNTLIINRYVKAIVKLDKKTINSIIENLSSLNNLHLNSQKFKDIINSYLHCNKKLEFVLSCIPKTDAKTTNLISLMANKNRLYLLPTLYKQLKLRIDKDNGIYDGEIYSNIDLSAKDIKEYEKKLSDKLKVKLSLKAIKSNFDGIKVEIADLGMSVILSKTATKQKIINHILKGIGV